ncbi:MAG: Sjogren's syndrome/scleroderma autoantigen 1 family protein [Halorientalis sp.]
MSDFDKEAEREKLREKYEHDEDDREATERMSDLLLKGATMTNAHCGTCGDPIFRYEGQEFCPTCQEVISEDGEDAGDASENTGDAPEGAADTRAAESAQETPGPRAPDGAATEQAAPDADPSAEPSTEVDAETPQHTGNGRADAGASATPDMAGHTDGTDASNQPADWTSSIDPSVADAAEPGQSANTSQATAPGSPSAGGAGTDTPSATGDLADARDSLTRTITRLTRQAEASDDLERTRAYLAAVEEAADALAAVKRADR